MIRLTDDQRSDAWRLARCGRVTSSRVADMMATLKDGKKEAAGRRNYRIQLVLERLTGQPQENGYVSPDMQRGTDMEPEAFGAYEAQTGNLALPVGFVAHDTLMAGCSPDGQVDNFTGLIELKVCKSATHLDYLRSKTIPGEYLKQIQHQLFVTGAQWCDFTSYDPRFAESLRLQITRVWAKDLDLAAHELNVRLFLSEVEKEVEEVKRMAAERTRESHPAVV